MLSSSELSNTNMVATFQEGRRCICLADRTDPYNEPRAYTKNIRNIEKGWKALQEQFNINTKFWDAIHLLDSFNLKVHEYCAMD